MCICISLYVTKCAYRDGWMADRSTGNMDMVATRRLLVKFEHGHGKSIAINKINILKNKIEINNIIRYRLLTSATRL